MRSPSPPRESYEIAYARYMGGYGPRPKPKAKLPPLSQLEERNKHLREEIAALCQKVEGYNNEDRDCKVKVAQLSGELGALTLQCERLEKQTQAEEDVFATEKARMEVEIGSLQAERDAWLRRMWEFHAAAVETEKEITESDEVASRGVQERRQLQSECLSLQQECEDARVELQETRDLLRQTGYTVERMIRQKVDLEWELKEQATNHEVLRTVLTQAGQRVANEADEAQRQREWRTAANRPELEKELARAEAFRCAAVADQRELDVLNSERTRLEEEAAGQVNELMRLEQLRKELEEENLQEHHQQGMKSAVLETARRRRDEISTQLEKMQMQSRDYVNKVAEVQSERTKLLLGNAQQQAWKLLALDAPQLPLTPAGSAGRSRH